MRAVADVLQDVDGDHSRVLSMGEVRTRRCHEGVAVTPDEMQRGAEFGDVECVRAVPGVWVVGAVLAAGERGGDFLADAAVAVTAAGCVAA